MLYRTISGIQTSSDGILRVVAESNTSGFHLKRVSFHDYINTIDYVSHKLPFTDLLLLSASSSMN